MQIFLIFLFVGAGLLPLKAELPAFNQEKLDEYWNQHLTPETWDVAYDELGKQLQETHQKDGVKSFTENADFTPWFYTWVWLRLGLYNEKIRNDTGLIKAFVELGRMPEASHLFIRTLRYNDSKTKAPEILTRLYQASPQKMKDYAALAVAHAVVFDQEFPKNWPHHQVKAEAVPIGNTDPVERYLFYIECNEAKNLDLDLKELSATELKFMVDSQVTLEELRYAQKTKFARSKLEKAFSSIVYDHKRIETKNYVWNVAGYRLQDIEQNGGICVDQAYYSSTVGKGRGVPTLYFTGQGTDGGHAWFGFMTNKGKWELDCGRYESQNYPIGYASDPQTWLPINDAELQYLFRDLTGNPNEAAAQASLIWAFEQSGLKNDVPALLSYFKTARSLAPENPEIWKYENILFLKAKTEPAQMKPFYEAWILQFSKNSDMKVEGQHYLLDILNKMQDPGAAELKKDIVRENRRKRFDLGIGAGAGQIFEQLEAKNWIEAEKEFKKMIRQFDDQGGGNLFYQIIKPYVQTCLEEGQQDLAADALKYADKKIKRDIGSILDQEFVKLDDAVNGKKK